MTTRRFHSWTVSDYSHMYWLLKHGHDFKFIYEFFNDYNFFQDSATSEAAVYWQERTMQEVWRKHLGMDYNKDIFVSNKTKGAAKKMSQALKSEEPEIVKKWRNDQGKSFGPRDIRIAKCERPKSVKKVTSQKSLWTAIEIAPIIHLIKSGYNNLFISEKLLNIMRYQQTSGEIIKQCEFVRAFLLSKTHGREKEYSVEAYPIDLNLRMIVNAIKIPIVKELREFIMSDQKILGPSHYIPKQKIIEDAEQEIVKEDPIKPVKENQSIVKESDSDIQKMKDLLDKAQQLNLKGIELKIGDIYVKIN